LSNQNAVGKMEGFILEAYDNFIQKYSNKDKYGIDVFVVMEISKRFYMDEARIKNFHPQIKELDDHKKAGYLTYWASKLKPIAVRDFSVYDDNPTAPHYINELFAVHLGFGKINYSQKPDNKIGSGIITAEFMSSLLHTLKFRATTGDNLSMIFYLVDEIVPLKAAVVNLGAVLGQLNSAPPTSP